MDLQEEDAWAHLHGVCFKTGPPTRVGVEIEWFVHDRSEPLSAVTRDRLDAALADLDPRDLPGGSILTREPGGQVELSSRPAATLADCVSDVAADQAVLARTLGEHGLVLVGNGLEPLHDPLRVLEHPRYRAMEAHFDHLGPWGRMMMRSTAAVQISLDAGDDGPGATGYRHRWELAHRLGPVLVAAFANSPIRRGAPTGWCSSRQVVWGRMERGRTRPPRYHRDPREAWARYALDAPLLCLRSPDSDDWSAPHGLTFRSWLRDHGDLQGVRRPTLEDLDYHVTTLFPPVRPRGWLELRMIDSQAGDGWQVATAVANALLDDPAAADAAYEATEPLCTGPSPLPRRMQWMRAARLGPADSEIGKAVRACLAAAESALSRMGAPSPLRHAVGAFIERYAERGRCPAHDQLDALSRGAFPVLP